MLSLNRHKAFNPGVKWGMLSGLRQTTSRKSGWPWSKICSAFAPTLTTQKGTFSLAKSLLLEGGNWLGRRGFHEMDWVTFSASHEVIHVIRPQPKNAMVFVHLTAAPGPPDLGFIDHDYPLLAIFQAIKPTDIYRHHLYVWPFLGSHRIAKMEEPSNSLIL